MSKYTQLSSKAGTALEKALGATAAGTGLALSMKGDTPRTGASASWGEPESVQESKGTPTEEAKKNASSIVNAVKNAPPKKVEKTLLEQIEAKYPIPPTVTLTKEELERRETAKQGIAAAALEFKQAKDVEQRAEIIETLSHALARLGAGLTGIQTGVDVSKLDLKATDWRERRRQDQQDAERQRKANQDEINEVDRDVSERRKQRERALERRTDASASAIGKMWTELREDEKETFKSAERNIIDSALAQAKGDAASQKLIQSIDMAKELKRQAQESSSDKDRDRLLAKSRQELLNAGIPSDKVENVFSQVDEPNWFMRLFGAKADPNVRENLDPEDVHIDTLKALVPAKNNPSAKGLDRGRLSMLEGDDREEADALIKYLSSPEAQANPKQAQEVRQILRNKHGI